jgi:hypothetical protein
MTPTWRPGLCWTVLSHLFDSRELAVEPRRILKRAAKRARCQARTSLCATYKCSRTGLAQGQAGEPHWTTRGRDALATGEEPPVLWKNHAAFIAILLQSGGGSEGKTGIQDGGLLCRVRAGGSSINTSIMPQTSTTALSAANLTCRCHHGHRPAPFCRWTTRRPRRTASLSRSVRPTLVAARSSRVRVSPGRSDQTALIVLPCRSCGD